MMWMFVHLMLSQGSFKLSSFYQILFFSSARWFPLLCLPAHTSVPLYHLLFCWFLWQYFNISVTEFFIFIWFCFIVFNSLLKFSLCSSILLSNSLSIFMIIILKSLLDRLFMSSLFSSFSDILSCSSCGTHLSFSSLCLNLSVCFYVLSRSVTFPDLGEVLSCRRHLMGPNSTLPTSYQW